MFVILLWMRLCHNFYIISLLRLRTEINRLIVAQSSKVKDPGQAAAYQCNMFEILLQIISVSIIIILFDRNNDVVLL